MSVDYGSKRIGLAVAEESSRLVLPLQVIENYNREQVLKELRQLIKEKNITKLVVGLPFSLSGGRGPKAQETQIFIDSLKGNLNLPIEAVDERVTSRMADILAQGTAGSRDIGAAMVILEDYLSRNL